MHTHETCNMAFSGRHARTTAPTGAHFEKIKINLQKAGMQQYPMTSKIHGTVSTKS